MVTNLPMKTRNKTARCRYSLNESKAKLPWPDYSALAAVGAVIALLLLSGCSSAPVAGGSDAWQYNSVTGYPAVGASNSDW